MTENNGENVRQVSIVSMNESVNLLSSYSDENMDYLAKKALSLMNEIKKGDEK